MLVAASIRATCEAPPDDAILWRYMDFLKFVDILERRCLWLTRLDLLDDPREGRLTDVEYRQVADREDNLKSSLDVLPRVTDYVNCWQEKASESMPMWDLHGGRPGSIAVKTNLKTLKMELDQCPYCAYLARVKYYEWKADSPWPNNVIGMAVRRADSYRHEDEVRIVVWSPMIDLIGARNEPHAEGGEARTLR